MVDIVRVEPKNLDECIKYSKLQRINGLYIYLHTAEGILEKIAEGLEHQLEILSDNLVEEVFAAIDYKAIINETKKLIEKADFKESMRIVIEHFLKLHAVIHYVKKKLENSIRAELER